MRFVTKISTKYIVLAASITQFFSPLFSNLGSAEDTSANSDPAITPAGYAFVIWGLITFLALGYGIYQSLPKRHNAWLHQKLSRSLILVYLLFSVWLVAASYNWLATTVLVFLCMFIILIFVLEELVNESKKLLTIEKVLLLGQIALYTGWSTVAIFANTASALKYYGLSDVGIWGHIWQASILVGALLNSLFWISRFHRNWIYVAAIVWAFVGVFIGLRDFENTLLLQSISALAVVAVTALTFNVDKRLRLFLIR